MGEPTSAKFSPHSSATLEDHAFRTALDELAQMPEARQTGLTADALKKINEALAR